MNDGDPPPPPPPDDEEEDRRRREGEEEAGAGPPLIRPIAPSAVRRIVAGQAVTDLSSAVKELVDNAIDAGAGRVCVKLYDQGLEAIEVSDNGTGVPPSSRPLMATKHATSKLRRFDDLYRNSDRSGGGADANDNDDDDDDDDGDDDDDAGPSHEEACAPTLGFRGEALFCLANLSRSLSVATRTSDETGAGEQFSFDREGKLMAETIRRVPRPCGTTVTVAGLFESLPVRRADLRKRIRGQRQKLVKMMQGYAILCLGTQFNLSDVHSSKGNSNSKAKKKSKSGGNPGGVHIATSESSRTFEARTASILGPKFLSGLARIDVDLSGALAKSPGDANGDENANANEKASRWRVTGLVSHAPSSPRPSSARDLQFFSVNGRPVDLPSASRVLGDVWRNFDPSPTRRRPACVLAFTLPGDAFDVNLSPDKREVMFAEGEAVEDALREGLVGLWSGQSEGRFAANGAEGRSNAKKKKGGGAKDGEGVLGAMELLAKRSEEGSGPKRDEKEGASRKANDGEDDLTPKPRRRGTSLLPGAGVEPMVTPSDSEVCPTDPMGGSGPSQGDENWKFNSESNICDGALSGCQNNALEKEATVAQRENHAAPLLKGAVVHTKHVGDKRRDRRGWDQMQLPERARQQDRRGWEQMQLKFQRVEKKQLREALSPVIDRADAGRSEAGRGETTKERSSTRSLNANFDRAAVAERLSANETSRTKPSAGGRLQKRQKRNVDSFLDSFSFGSTRPVTTLKDLDSEPEGESEEHDRDHGGSETLVKSETEEIVDNSTRPSRKENDPSHRSERNVRMVAGRRSMIEKRPRTSLRGQSRNEETRRSSSPPSSEEYRKENDAEPESASNDASNDAASSHSEVVWDSFSGTKDVIEQSQKARMAMQKNRKHLRSSLKRKRKSDEDVNLTPDDFLRMSIIGQFNLGFVLARDRNHDLWIFDQHACDEKYNFERLCKETVIHEQKLIAPLPLELSPSEEHCVLEHAEDFERNGFRFSYDPDGEPRRRLSLTAIPHSGSGGDGRKAVQFGKEDVGALCAMLGADGTSGSDGYAAGFGAGLPEGGRIAGVNAVRRYAGLAGGGTRSDGIVGSSIVRLPKAIAMFASRACRGSIMIGTALTHKEQVNILEKLHKTDVPWNCAHGRPTMSHVTNLAKNLIDDDDAIASHVAGPSLSVPSEI